IGLYARTDFALIHLKQKMRTEPLKLASARPAVGFDIYVIGLHGKVEGAPNLQLFVSRGKVLTVKDGVIWHNAAVGDGSKGSAIVNAEGKVVGIHKLEVQLPGGKVARGGPSASSISEYRRQFSEFVKDLEKQTSGS